MNNKKRNDILMGLADKALNETEALFKKGTLDIPDSYNGQISAFGVAVAMSGIKPAVAIYYQDKDSNKVNKRAILRVIASMIKHDNANNYQFNSAEDLLRAIIKAEKDLNSLQSLIIDCSIALKQIVRTYNLVSDGK